MSDHYTPNYSESLDAITGGLERIADDMDECATLRDRFAMVALQGLLASDNGKLDTYVSIVCEHFAVTAYNIADAMLAMRKPKTEQP